jgi:transposase
MTKEFLEGCLAEGLSLDQIAARTGRHPSTVSYHLRKHRLTAVGHDKHTANGKVDPYRLRKLITDGVTVREAAAELGVGYSTVRHWIKRLGLETVAAKRRRENRDHRARGVSGTTRVCPKHGKTMFVSRPDGGFRCGKCRMDAVSKWRRRVKRRLVGMAGGCCILCGYREHVAALQFHHLDPSTKAFSISREGTTRSFTEVRAEAEKCVLLCANCHAAVEAGVKEIPAQLRTLRLASASGPGSL